LLRNSNIELHGKTQSLIDYFFSKSSQKDIMMNMAKKRTNIKDRT
jgi:hypothetical protein